MAGDQEIQRVQTFVRAMDRFYLDPILGLLLPGAGDVIGSVLGLYVIIIAARRKISPVVIARMLLNLAFDSLVGIIPILGDAFDLGFKANERNLALLVDRHSAGGKASARDWLAVAGAVVALLAVFALLGFAVVRFWQWVAHSR